MKTNTGLNQTCLINKKEKLRLTKQPFSMLLFYFILSMLNIVSF